MPFVEANRSVKTSRSQDADLALVDREVVDVRAPLRSCLPSGTEPSVTTASFIGLRRGNGARRLSGQLILNADDWGRDRLHTDQAIDCIVRKTVSSVSAMVFMEHSERAAAIALELGIGAGLHLNLTTPFSSQTCPTRLLEHQRLLSEFLLRHRFAPAIFHPGLIHSFKYVVLAQLEEFHRIYGAAPQRFDGHHHMHLCANMLVAGLLPEGSIVRRNFLFRNGEKGMSNRLYRRIVDRILARKYRLVDFFGSLSPINPADRLQRIISLAHHLVVELSVHPADPEEYRFLSGGEIFSRIGDVKIASRFAPLR
jgi:predicted glycoside hydrolase/deacetylase ChbG (UPF0249 family)